MPPPSPREDDAIPSNDSEEEDPLLDTTAGGLGHRIDPTPHRMEKRTPYDGSSAVGPKVVDGLSAQVSFGNRQGVHLVAHSIPWGACLTLPRPGHRGELSHEADQYFS